MTTPNKNPQSMNKISGEELLWMISIAKANEPAFGGSILIELWKRVRTGESIEKELFDYFEDAFSKIGKFGSVSKALNLERVKKPSFSTHLYTHIAFDYKRMKSNEITQYEAYESLSQSWCVDFTTIEKRLSEGKHTRPAKKMLNDLESRFKDDPDGLNAVLDQFDQFREEYILRKQSGVENPYMWRLFVLGE